MPTRAFSVEDGNIGTRTILSATNRNYSDIDLTFTKKATGDVFKKEHAAAVKQAVKNLLFVSIISYTSFNTVRHTFSIFLFLFFQ